MRCPKDGCKQIGIGGTAKGFDGKPTAKWAYFECGHWADIPSKDFWETALEQALESR